MSMELIESVTVIGGKLLIMAICLLVWTRFRVWQIKKGECE